MIVTFFTHKSARSKTEEEITLEELCERVISTRAERKDDLPWLKAAKFGHLETSKGSLRHDANVLEVHGVEADYDAEKMPFDEAKNRLNKAGIKALVYTSPSHEPDRPRWRVVAPFNTRHLPGDRAKHLARLNGVLDGVISDESFTLSQSYYYGHLTEAVEVRAEITDSNWFIDDLDDLDQIARGKSGRAAKVKGNGGPFEGVDLAEMGRRILSGESLHPSVGQIAGVYAGKGWPKETCIELVGACFAAAGAPRYAGRWDECVDFIEWVYAKEAEKSDDPESPPPPEPPARPPPPLPEDLRRMVERQGEPSEELFVTFINETLRCSVDENDIITACLANEPPYGGSIYKHVNTNGGEDYIKEAIARILNALPGRDERDEISIEQRGADTDVYWREVEKVLKKKKLPVYVRNNHLVWPRWRWHKGKDGCNYLSAELEIYSVVQLADMVAHHAVRFSIWDSRAKAWRDADPPAVIIRALRGAHQYQLPDIVGIITSPTMRSDLSLLTLPGYDERTQLWYKPSDNVELPPIPQRPTRNDSVKALKLLNNLLDGFPFEGEKQIKERNEGKRPDEPKEEVKSISRSAALAGLMTTVARGALNEAVPLFAVTANDPRTGKTYLIELIGVIAMSHKPVPTSGAEKKEEFEKRVETAALSGRQMIHLNNLPNNMTIESERLAELSTEGMVTIRLLGHHQEGQCDCRATTVFLNGNNIVMGGDLVFRTVGCRLDAEVEHPEERTFAFDPMQQVRADRGAYLAAVFTIIRAFFAAGAPKPANMKRVTGFDQWSKWIQQPLMWLGMPDPFGSMEKMRGRDPGQEKLLQVLQVLRDVFKTEEDRKAITVAECAKRAEQCPELRELMTVRGQINARSFGRLLTSYDGKIRDGWRIRVSDEPGKSHAYFLECVNPKPPTAEAASAAADGSM